MVDWIWRLYNISFENGGVLGDWKSAVILPLYKSKGERTVYKNYRDISLLNMVGKIYAGILVDRIHRGTGDLRAGSGCIDQIFTLKQMGEKA